MVRINQIPFSIRWKAKVYQYTRLYLAQKEENEYFKSEGAKELIEQYKWSPELVRDIWRARNYFFQAHCPLTQSHYRIVRFLAWFVVFYRQLKWDIKSFFA
jgi:hypothetical protein